MYAAAGAASTGLQGIFGIAQSTYDNYLAHLRESEAREENYLYGEQAANNADKRTRSLYNDLYSPAAQLGQLKAAGLSPSLFYGDGGGISGQAGAQGTGASGVSPTVFGTQMPDIASTMLQVAQAKKAEAETELVKSETTQTDLENEAKELQNTEYKTEFTITNSHISENDEELSLFEIAETFDDYDKFVSKVRDIANNAENLELRDATSTEKGQEVLRKIFMDSQKMSHDISVLSSEKIDAKFYENIVEALQKENFAKLSAKAQCEELRKVTEDAELTAREKRAWNRLLNKLGDSTGSDIAIVIGLMLREYLSNKHSINYKSGNRQQNIVNGNN